MLQGTHSHCPDAEGGCFLLMKMNVLFKANIVNLWWPRTDSNSELTQQVGKKSKIPTVYELMQLTASYINKEGIIME